eukprot:CAMPEP_0174245230 /NCGR_PEP_ID=MMETSP0417-20130205/38007_1 /TAXON_ID=242541 /ORGANISM="Mayorella sp, Strain BSH-02190019" /LENGTH=981 /DNA_ID=CAMNT_0015324989 /DNA_START=75 /DNA_END=3020 /DNA_ORIENTATION=-
MAWVLSVPHDFDKKKFGKPPKCALCKGKVWPSGFQCSVCKVTCHKKCVRKLIEVSSCGHEAQHEPGAGELDGSLSATVARKFTTLTPMSGGGGNLTGSPANSPPTASRTSVRNQSSHNGATATSSYSSSPADNSRSSGGDLTSCMSHTTDLSSMSPATSPATSPLVAVRRPPATSPLVAVRNSTHSPPSRTDSAPVLQRAASPPPALPPLPLPTPSEELEQQQLLQQQPQQQPQQQQQEQQQQQSDPSASALRKIKFPARPPPPSRPTSQAFQASPLAARLTARSATVLKPAGSTGVLGRTTSEPTINRRPENEHTVQVDNSRLVSMRTLLKMSWAKPRLDAIEKRKADLLEQLEELESDRSQLLQRIGELDTENVAMRKKFCRTHHCERVEALLSSLASLNNRVSSKVSELEQSLSPSSTLSAAQLSQLQNMHLVAHDIERSLCALDWLDDSTTELRTAVEVLSSENDKLEDRMNELLEQQTEIQDRLVKQEEVSLRLDSLAAAVRTLEESLQSTTSLEATPTQQFSSEVNKVADGFSGLVKAGDTMLLSTAALIPEEKLFQDTDEIRFQKDGTKTTPIIVAALPNRLVERLVFHKYPDVEFQKALLLTYRTFMSPPELMQKLILRYCLTPPPSLPVEELMNVRQVVQLPVQLRVMNLVRYWIENHYHDFEVDLLQIFEQFFEQHMTMSHNTKLIASVATLLEKKKTGAALVEMSKFRTTPPAPEVTNMDQIVSRQFTIRDVSSVEMARQLTLMEHVLYKKLQPKEFIGLCWSKKNKECLAPNILAAIRGFNHISMWVCTEITRADSLTSRTEILTKFMEIAHHCYRLNNFDGALAIVSGLSNSAVHRLKHTWEGVDQSWIDIYDDLRGLMQVNYKRFRAELHSANPPCVPYIGTYLTDLTFTEEGNPDFIEGRLVNLKKLRQVAQIIREVQQYQQDTYCFQPIPEIQDYIRDYEVATDSELYDLSLRLETKKLSKLLGN